MTTQIINGMTVLTADSGKYLHNGDTYTDSVYLGIYDSAENWEEVDTIPDAVDTPDALELTAEEKLEKIEEVYDDV